MISEKQDVLQSLYLGIIVYKIKFSKQKHHVQIQHLLHSQRSGQGETRHRKVERGSSGLVTTLTTRTCVKISN